MWFPFAWLSLGFALKWIREAFEKLNQNHFLVHFHPNTGCGLRNHNGVNIPNVFECTYLHKKYFTRFPELNSDTIPGTLDMKNMAEIIKAIALSSASIISGKDTPTRVEKPKE